MFSESGPESESLALKTCTALKGELLNEFEITIHFGHISVDKSGFTVTGSRVGKLVMGEESRVFSFDELRGFKLHDGNLLVNPHLAIEGPFGRTNLGFMKTEREAVDRLVAAIRERAPQAKEGVVTKNLQLSEKTRGKLESSQKRAEDAQRKLDDLQSPRAALDEATETLKSAPSASASRSGKETAEQKLERLETDLQEELAKSGDRTNFMMGTYGKKITSFEGVDLYEKAIKFDGKAWAISGAEISMEMGAPKSRMTLTRIGTGALLFGGTGAIVGGMSKKNKQKGFIEIITDDGGFVIEFSAKLEKKARQFTMELKSASRK